MARWGEGQIYVPAVRGNKLAELFLKVFGTVDTSSWRLHFMRIVKRVAREGTFDRILDAGCGKGTFSFWLAREYPNARIDALDLSKDKIDLCKEVQERLRIRNVSFFVQDLLTFKSEGVYDFILSNHVLEHIAASRLAIANLVASLKEGGHIYIGMPNAVQRKPLLGKRFVKSYEEWAKKEHVGQMFTLDSLSSELERLSCKILIAKHTAGFWGVLRFELAEMALSYFHSRALFALLYPLLKLLGYIDSRVNYSDGNSILVLARKIKAESDNARIEAYEFSCLRRDRAT